MRLGPRLALAVLLTGCTNYGATNSPVTRDNAVTPSELAGRWLSVGQFPRDMFGSDSVCLTLAPQTAVTYTATLGGCRKASTDRIAVEFTELGGELFASTQPQSSDTALAGVDDALLLYSFYRLRARQDSLWVAGLDGDSLRTFLFNHPAALPFTFLEGNGPDILLTATTEQLQAFLALHARDEQLWGTDSTSLAWRRIR